MMRKVEVTVTIYFDEFMLELPRGRTVRDYVEKIAGANDVPPEDKGERIAQFFVNKYADHIKEVEVSEFKDE